VTKIHEDGTGTGGFVPSFGWWSRISFIPVIPWQAGFHGFLQG